MIRRWLPYPLISAALLALWLLLNQSLWLGHVLLGALLAVWGGRLLAKLELPAGPVRRPAAALRLFGLVLMDVARSNVAVARIILGQGGRHQTAGFLRIPLDLQDRRGLTVLACIITATPGTLWVEYDPAERVLLLHVLDLIDEQAWIDIIKGRYERLLLEVFQ